MELRISNGSFSVILVLISHYILTADAIKCYKCIFATYIYFANNTLLCKDFDYSDKFITDCPYSTLCMKKNFYAVLNGEQINATERDCASQKLDTQRILNGKWQAEIHVEEPYTEGCKKEDTKHVKTPYIEHCYCRGDLCNAGNSVHGKNSVLFYYRTLLLSVASVIMTIKTSKLVFL